MDNHQTARRDFIVAFYAAWAIAFGLALTVETFTRDYGFRNAVLALDSARDFGVVTEVEPLSEVYLVTYRYRHPAGGEVDGTYRLAFSAVEQGHPEYVVGEAIELDYAPDWPEISFPALDAEEGRRAMVVWSSAASVMAVVPILLILTVWRHVRFVKFLKRN